MKEHYPRYGRRTAELEAGLNEEDKRVLKEFLEYCATTASPRRVRTKYRSTILQFRDVVEKPLSETTARDAIAFWGLVNGSGYEERTKIDIKRAVRRFLKFRFKDLEMLEPLKVPKQRVNQHRVNKSSLFTEGELKMMLHRAESLRDKALLTLLYETAARPQEVSDLRWRDVNWSEAEVRLYSTKTSSDRCLPVKDSLKQLHRWHQEWTLPDPEPTDCVFPATIGAHCVREKGLSVTYINRIIKRLARRAGITRPVNTYLLRHTRLTELHRKQVQGREWKLFAGHTPDSKMEATYIHLSNDDMKESVLSKVYGVAELPKEESEVYKHRIERLETQNSQMREQLNEVLSFLRSSRTVAMEVSGELSK